MRTSLRLTSLCMLTLMLASCGVPITSGSQFAQGVDRSEPLTFGWNQARDRAAGDPRLENNQFFEESLHEAIDWQLSLRGLRHADESPDLLIHHHLTLVDHEMVEEIIDEEGYAREEVYSYEQGTVVVHIVNARTGGNFWIAWGQANVEPALRGPDEMRNWVYDVVGQMFSGWPVPERTTS